MANTFGDNIQKIAKTKTIEQKAVPPLVGAEKGEKLGNRSVGYLDTKGQDPVPPENKPSDITDLDYVFAEIVDGVREPKTDEESIGSITECYAVSNTNITVILRANGIFTEIDNSATPGASAYYFTHRILAEYYTTWLNGGSEYFISGFEGDNTYTVPITTNEADAVALVATKVLAGLAAVEGPRFTYTVTSGPTAETAAASTEWLAVTGATNKLYRIEITEHDEDGIFPDNQIVDFIWGWSSEFLPIDWNANFQYPEPDYDVVGGDCSVNSRNSIYSMAPNDGEYTLQIALGTDGLWTADPDFPSATVPVEYRTPIASIPVKFGEDKDRDGLIEPTKQAGLVLYETVAGTPTGDARVYRRNRTRLDIIAASKIGQVKP